MKNETGEDGPAHSRPEVREPLYTPRYAGYRICAGDGRSAHTPRKRRSVVPASEAQPDQVNVD